MLGYPQCGLETPRCGAGDPPGVGLETPLGVGLEIPLGVGLETPQVCAWRPSWVWAWRPARHGGIPPPEDLQGTLGYQHPPVNRMTDRCKNITLPQTSFASSKNRNENNTLDTGAVN